MTKQTERLVEVEATAKFKNDGKDVRPGETISVTVADALDLIATGFAIKPYTYRDRAMRSSSR